MRGYEYIPHIFGILYFLRDVQFVALMFNKHFREIF